MPSPPSLPVNVHAWEAMLSPLSDADLGGGRGRDRGARRVVGTGDGEGDGARQGRDAEAALNIEGVPLLGAARQRLGGRRPVV